MTDWRSIDGWFSDGDAVAYRKLVNAIPKGGHMVEVGAWLGRSLGSIADILKERKIHVMAVDTFEGSPEHAHLDKTNLKERFTENMLNLGLDLNHLEVCKMPSLRATVFFSPKTLRLVFIDAQHDYENAKADILAWAPLTRVIAGHDYTPGWCGVPNAIADTIGDVTVEPDSCVWWKKL